MNIAKPARERVSVKSVPRAIASVVKTAIVVIALRGKKVRQEKIVTAA
ncbi:MAG: hypothetical protein HZB62_04245 [Nitrospirae bacterium]|nr:hypothetical protein [Nitrospirota bacterium]